MNAAAEGTVDDEVTDQLKQMREKFEAAMNDDLNTSVALSVLFDMVRLTNGLLEDSNTTVATLSAVDVLFGRLGGEVLGIVKDEYPQIGTADEQMLDKLVGVLIEQRNEARNKKDFAAADAIRDKLSEIGIALEDKPDETIWRRK
jgi:cysteinyl-tRNA synthetase